MLIVSKSWRPVVGSRSSNILPAHRTMTDYGEWRRIPKTKMAAYCSGCPILRAYSVITRARGHVSRRHGVLLSRPKRRTMQRRQDWDIESNGTILRTQRHVSVAIGHVVGQRVHFACGQGAVSCKWWKQRASCVNANAAH